MTANLTLHHCPNSRSTGVLALLEELHVPYDLHVMNMKKKENREAAYLAINPIGKVPAIEHDGTLTGNGKARLAPLALHSSMARSTAALAPAITT